MIRVCVCTLMLVSGVFLASSGSLGQEKKKKDDKTDPPPKVKGMLPQYWGKLGLSNEQKQTQTRTRAWCSGVAAARASTTPRTPRW